MVVFDVFRVGNSAAVVSKQSLTLDRKITKGLRCFGCNGLARNGDDEFAALFRFRHHAELPSMFFYDDRIAD